MPLLFALERAYYTLKLSTTLRERFDTAFERFFQQIMQLRYPNGDFATVGPWGNVGDLKNDGYLYPTRQIFQCYAPLRLQNAPLIAKINEDFVGALTHWDSHFDEWVIVHNQQRCPAPAQLRLQALEVAHIPKRLRAWGEPELRDVVMGLDRPAVIDVFGPPMTEDMWGSIGFDEIEAVIRTIAAQTVPADAPVRPVPAGKIEANHLSQATETMLKVGMQKAQLVDDYFRRGWDPTLSDRVAERLRTHYVALRDAGTPPNEIMTELQRFTGGVSAAPPERFIAVYAVLAHFFERCDIFEEPRPADEGDA